MNNPQKIKKLGKTLSSFVGELLDRIFGEKAPKQKKVKQKTPPSEFTSFLLCLGVFAPICALILPLFVLFFTDDHVVVTDSFDLIAGYVNVFTKNLGGLCPALFSLGAWALLLGLIRLIFKKKVKKHCLSKTTFLSATAGVCASAAIYGTICALIAFITQSTYNRHPLAIRFGILLTVAALIVFAICIVFYIRARLKTFSAVGFALDLLCTLLVALSVFSLGEVARAFLSAAAKMLEL